MGQIIIKSLFLYLLCTLFFHSLSQAQEEYEYRYSDGIERELIATNDPDFKDYGDTSERMDIDWIEVEAKCRKCRTITKRYNEAMEALLATRRLVAYLNLQKIEYDEVMKKRAESERDPKNTTTTQSEANMASALAYSMATHELYQSELPRLKESLAKQELAAKYIRRQMEECELTCNPPDEDQKLISMPGGGEIRQDPPLPFDWKGPYYEVCERCRKLAARLNELYDLGIDNSAELAAVQGGIDVLNGKIKYWEIVLNSIKEEFAAKEIRRLRKEISKREKNLKRVLKNRDKLIDNFNKTLSKYNDCIKKCPPQKNACPFPEDLFEPMTLGANNEVGSSAQAAKEMRDKVTGAAKGAATKALGSFLGIGGLGGGGSKGPKTDRDRTKGDFVRVSSGDTDLDIRAGWRDDQLIVSTEIDNTPGDGTFHAQWLEDQNGNIYLPTRYLIFKLYRDWKLTVSWTEDHYVNGEHVYHAEGQEVSVGRDLLGTWTLFDGENAATNSIWGMLGFDTAAKGVKHIGAVYDIPPSAFPDNCQLRLVTHISEPDKDPVTTRPVIGNLFKHVDESKRRPETMILVQPHIVEVQE